MLYPVLPGMLDSNPFSESGQLQVSKEVRRVLEICTKTLQLVREFQVHPEITSQLFAYLFFFINALLFNLLMERGKHALQMCHMSAYLRCHHTRSFCLWSCLKDRGERFTSGPVGSRSGLIWICLSTGHMEQDWTILHTATFSNSHRLSIYWPRPKKIFCRLVMHLYLRGFCRGMWSIVN